MGDSRGSGRRGRSGGEVSIQGREATNASLNRVSSVSRIRYDSAVRPWTTKRVLTNRSSGSTLRSPSNPRLLALRSLPRSLVRPSPRPKRLDPRSNLRLRDEHPRSRAFTTSARRSSDALLQRARAPEDHAQSLRARQSDVQTPWIGEKTDVATRISTHRAHHHNLRLGPRKPSTLCTPGAAGASARTAPAVALRARRRS